MAQVKIYDIALDLEVCPECLIEAVNASGIDTFSSRVKFDEILAVAKMPAGRQPSSYEGSWLYWCDAHWDEFDHEDMTTNHDECVEIEDVIETDDLEDDTDDFEINDADL